MVKVFHENSHELWNTFFPFRVSFHFSRIAFNVQFLPKVVLFVILARVPFPGSLSHRTPSKGWLTRSEQKPRWPSPVPLSFLALCRSAAWSFLSVLHQHVFGLARWARDQSIRFRSAWERKLRDPLGFHLASGHELCSVRAVEYPEAPCSIGRGVHLRYAVVRAGDSPDARDGGCVDKRPHLENGLREGGRGRGGRRSRCGIGVFVHADSVPRAARRIEASSRATLLGFCFHAPGKTAHEAPLPETEGYLHVR